MTLTEEQVAAIHDAVNEISDLVATAVITSSMSLDDVWKYYEDRLQKIDAQSWRMMRILLEAKDTQ